MRRSRTTWTAAAATVLAATSLLVTPTGSAVAPAVTGSLASSHETVGTGDAFTLRGSLPPRRSRTVRLQVRRSGSWESVATKQSSRRGAFRFTVTAPPRAAVRTYRVAAPATTIRGRRYPAVVTPTRAVTVVGTVAVDAGWQHACALGSDGSAWCWGDNTFGALGDGSTVSFQPRYSSGPVRVVGSDWTAISAAGADTCGLRDDATAWCWGDRTSMGMTDPSEAGTPQQVPGAWSQVSRGASHACGVRTDGTGWCWGDNGWGQLGQAEPAFSAAPLQVPGTWLELVAGFGYATPTTCGIRSDHSAWCWGVGSSGQLGNGATDSSVTPVQVAGDHQWSSLSVGGSHACGLDTAGAPWCWGANQDGRLGDGTFTERTAPVEVTIPGPWDTLDAGLQHTCGAQTNGEGWCWGWNDHGQLGDGTFATTYWPEPVPHQLTGSWTAVVAGFFGSAGLSADGSVLAWGEGAHGELGAGPSDPSAVPTEIAGLP